MKIWSLIHHAALRAPLRTRRGHRLSVLLTLLIVFFSASGFAEYRTLELESLRITIDTDWAYQGTPGYFPIRMDIQNLGGNREIRIVGADQRYFDLYRRGRPVSAFGGPTQVANANFSQTIRLKRGDHWKKTLAVPVMADNENVSIRIWEKGRPIEGFISNSSMQSSRDPQDAAILFVTDPSGALGVEAAAWSRFVSPPKSGRVGYAPRYAGSSGTVPRLDLVLDPDRIPANWLGFTSLRAVAIAPADWGKLSSSQKDAVLTWTAGGGDLLVIDGTLDTVLSADNRPAGLRTTNEAFNNYYLGHIHLVKSEDIRNQGLEAVLSKTDIVSPYADWTLPVNRAMDFTWIASRGFHLPIEGVGGVPTKGYLSMLVLFTVVIGPLNYLYLWRKRQQVFLVLTVPLISLLFIVVIAAYAFLGEGIAIRGRATSFTVLDQTTKQAATRSTVSLYAGGIAPSGGLTFPAQFAVFPRGTDGVGPRGTTALDLTDSQRFSNGLLQARSPSNFEQIAFGAARERLSFERRGNEFSVVNGLGSTVKQLYYRENNRTYSMNGTLEAGQKGSLRPGTIIGKDVYADAVKLAAAVHSPKFQALIDTQPDRTYLAVLETSPFWDSGVVKLEEHSSFHLVLGYVGGLP